MEKVCCRLRFAHLFTRRNATLFGEENAKTKMFVDLCLFRLYYGMMLLKLRKNVYFREQVFLLILIL